MAILIPKISDVQISISTVHPQNLAGLNTTAFFVQGQTQSFKTYYLPDDVANDYPENSDVLNAATTLFAQDASPDALQIITYVSSANQASAPSSNVSSATSNSTSTSTSGASSNGSTPSQSADGTDFTGIKKAAYDYFYKPWDYAILIDYNKSDALDLADIIENGGDDGKGFHLLFLQFNDSTLSDVSAFAQYTRTWTYYHDIEGESIVSALTGEAGAQTTGTASWEFVSNLANITPINTDTATHTALTATQVERLEKQGLIMYVQKGTYANFTSSENPSGNFVDVYAGEDWIKANLESAIQNALADYNGSGRVKFDARGIAKIGATMVTVLDQGYAQGIIDTNPVNGKADYTTSLPSIDAVSGELKERRILNNVKFSYNAAGEIAKVYVKGTAIA